MGHAFGGELQPVGTKAGPTATASASPNSGVTTYASTTPLVCDINSITGALTVNGAGTCPVTADNAGGGNYAPAQQIIENIEVARASVVLTWDAPPSGLIYGVPRIHLHRVELSLATAVATPNVGTIIYSSFTPLVCTIDANSGILTLTGPGTCTLTANDEPGGNYLRAAEISESFTIGAVARNLPATFYFATNRFALNSGAKQKLAVIANSVVSGHITSIVLNGYADERGTSTWNRSLSWLRANSVRRYLLAALASRHYHSLVVVLHAHGATRMSPILAKNRKVTITS